VGQRKGLGPVLTNQYGATIRTYLANPCCTLSPLLHPVLTRYCAKGPWHVTRKDIPANTLYASRQYAADDKPRNAFVADSLNWVAGAPPRAAAEGRALSVRVKTRHGAQSHAAEVVLDAEGRAHVQLDGRDKGLAPGQFAAWYDGEVCLGSGVISEEGL